MTAGKQGPPDTIGARIVRARLQLAASRGSVVTQAAIARAVGVAPGTVSQWESGATTPALDTLPLLAAALGVAPEWIAWGMSPAEEEPFAGIPHDRELPASTSVERTPTAKRAGNGGKRK